MNALRTACLLMLAATAAAARAAPDTTVEAAFTHSALNAGLPGGDAANLRYTRLLGGDDVVRAEALAERKFGLQGGLYGAGFSKGVLPDTFVTASAAFGYGGVNWARRRFDLGVGVKLGAQRDTIASASFYNAAYDEGRRDRGLVLTLVAYRWSPLVLQAGMTVNLSDPGRVSSAMFNASGSWGREGQQFLTLRVAYGSESYQALGAGAALADFNSQTLAFAWRRWIGADWGFNAQLEQYHNPTYDRTSVGASLFAQF